MEISLNKVASIVQAEVETIGYGEPVREETLRMIEDRTESFFIQNLGVRIRPILEMTEASYGNGCQVNIKDVVINLDI